MALPSSSSAGENSTLDWSSATAGGSGSSPASRSSGRINHAARRQDVVPPERIPDEFLLHEIDPSSENDLELLAHRLPEAAPRTEVALRILERDQHIDVAV